MYWYLEVLRNYAVFTGRARRMEYWMFFLFNIIISIIIGVIEATLNIDGTIGTVYTLAILIPSIAVTVRRLHDIDRTGWWALVSLVPLIGFFILLYFTVLDSTPGANQYGPNPKEV